MHSTIVICVFTVMLRKSLLVLLVAGSALTVIYTDGLTAGSPDGAPSDFSRGESFDVVASGSDVYLLFGQTLSPGGDLRLFFTRSTDSGTTWSQPIPIPTDHAPPGRHQRGHDPQLAISGNRLLALWTARGDGPWGSGSLATARSNDGGRTWNPGPPPVADLDEPAGFRFPAVTASKDSFHAVWIHARGDERSLRHARLEQDAATWAPPTIIDPDICACCWNTLEVGADGRLFVLYRDQDPSDMALAVSDDSGSHWHRIGSVGAFGWHFNGCPHVGGSLLLPADDAALFATVWTGDPAARGAYRLVSRDGGLSWNAHPLPNNEIPGNVHTDSARLPNGQTGIVWDRHPLEGSRRTIYFAASPGDLEASWTEPKAISDGSRTASHPRIISLDDRFLILWTETADGESFLQMESRVK